MTRALDAVQAQLGTEARSCLLCLENYASSGNSSKCR